MSAEQSREELRKVRWPVPLKNSEFLILRREAARRRMPISRLLLEFASAGIQRAIEENRAGI